MNYFDRVSAAAAWLTQRVGTFPDTAVVLGSGLGDFGESLADATAIPYGDIPHCPASAVVGHAGKLVVGRAARAASRRSRAARTSTRGTTCRR